MIVGFGKKKKNPSFETLFLFYLHLKQFFTWFYMSDLHIFYSFIIRMHFVFPKVVTFLCYSNKNFNSLNKVKELHKMKYDNTELQERLN